MYRERTKQDRHETPVGVRYSRTGPSLSDQNTLWDSHRPASETEELMQPGEDSGIDPDLWPLLEMVMSKASLTPKEQAVIDMVIFGQHSLATTGRLLGLEFRQDGKPYSKMMVSKLRDSALNKLRVAFLQETSTNDE